MTMLPTERDLPPDARAAARARVVAAVGPPSGRRWVPLAAAAGLVAVVAASALAGSSGSGTDPVPTAPAAGSGRPSKPSPPPAPPAPPAPSGSTTAPAPPGTPSLAQVRDRCGMIPEARYLARYVDDDAVSWLFLHPPETKTSIVCTWRVGDTGPIASFANDWLVPPIPGGRYEGSHDDLSGVGLADRWAYVARVPDRVTSVLLRISGEVYRPGFADGWVVFHHRGGHPDIELFGYDADGGLVPRR